MTSLVLGKRYERGLRGPFGNSTAIWWWCTLLFCDSVVAALMLGGASLIAVPIAASEPSGLWRAAAIGILGPLSLRSPVFEEKEVKGETYNIGFTYIYDYFWRDYHRNLDVAMSSLRINDRTKLLGEIQANGWTAEMIARRIRDHISALVTWSDLEKQDFGHRVDAVMDNSDLEGDKLRGLVEIVRSAKLNPILTPCRKNPPTTADGTIVHAPTA